MKQGATSAAVQHCAWVSQQYSTSFRQHLLKMDSDPHFDIHSNPNKSPTDSLTTLVKEVKMTHPIMNEEK